MEMWWKAVNRGKTMQSTLSIKITPIHCISSWHFILGAGTAAANCRDMASLGMERGMERSGSGRRSREKEGEGGGGGVD